MEEDSSSSESELSLEEGSYDADGNISAKCEINAKEGFQFSGLLKGACEVFNQHLAGVSTAAGDQVEQAQQLIKHEWLKTAARRQSNPQHIEAFLDSLENYSRAVMRKVVNMCDPNVRIPTNIDYFFKSEMAVIIGQHCLALRMQFRQLRRHQCAAGLQSMQCQQAQQGRLYTSDVSCTLP